MKATMPGRFITANGYRQHDTELCYCSQVRRGGCMQGRRCPLNATEMACEVTHDADRFTTPDESAACRRARLSANLRALAAGIGGLIGFALILALIQPGT